MRFVSPNEASFKVLFDKHYRWIYDKAYQILRNHQDTEEVSLDIFMKAWNKIDRWDVDIKENEGAWLNVVAKNTIIDAIRKKKRNHESLISLEDESEIPLAEYKDSQPTPDEQVESQEAHDILKQALQRVRNPNHRDAWILHHLKGCSIAETSSSLGCCVNTVKIWIFRCNEEIRVTLTRKGERWD